MKKFKNIIGLFIVFLAVALFGSACSCNKPDLDMPNVNASVVGNGGLMVQKGEYLYFVNGFISQNEGYNDNKYGKMKRSAIYRVKVTGYSESVIGNIDFEDEELEEVIIGGLAFNSGNFTETDNGSAQGAELVVSAKVGFEFGSFYIFKDYLYYITPSNKLDKNQPIKNQVEINRVKLNGEDNKNIATVKDYTETAQFGFYASGNDVYGFVYNGTELLITKNDKVDKRIDDVKSVVFPTQREWYVGMQQTEHIWFTTESGAKLNRFNLAEKKHEVMESAFDGETLIGAANGKLFYKKGEMVYRYKMDRELFISAATSFLVIDENLLIETTETGYSKRQSSNNWIKQSEFFTGLVNIEAFTSDFMFFTEEGTVKQIAIGEINSLITVYKNEEDKSGKTNENGDVITTGELKTDNTKNVWTDGIFIYYYVKNTEDYITQNYYLKRTKLGGDFLVQQNVAVKLGDDGRLKPVDE